MGEAARRYKALARRTAEAFCAHNERYQNVDAEAKVFEAMLKSGVLIEFKEPKGIAK